MIVKHLFCLEMSNITVTKQFSVYYKCSFYVNYYFSNVIYRNLVITITVQIEMFYLTDEKNQEI